MNKLSDAELDALIGEATVDAYGEDEQLAGFTAVMEDNLSVPFKTTVFRAPRRRVRQREVEDRDGLLVHATDARERA